MSFTLCNESIAKMQTLLQSHHDVYKTNRCQGVYLEELFAVALDYDSRFCNNVQWECGSHAQGSDIHVPGYSVSIKTGKIDKKQGILNVSGFRLGKAGGSPEKMTEIIMENNSDVMLCCVGTSNTTAHLYQLIGVPGDAFVCNTESTWEPTFSKKTNDKLTGYTMTMPNGIVSTIYQAMSWQVWWKIPMALCTTYDNITIEVGDRKQQ